MNRYFIMITAVIALGLLAGCDDEQVPAAKWKSGEFVRSVLTDQRGQVIRVYCGVYNHVCEYDVRFANNVISTTDTHVLSQDGPITNPPVVDVLLEEFELKSDR
jgi:hypothetical protein